MSTNLQRVVWELQQNGYSYEDAVATPQAKQAARQDYIDARQHQNTRSKAEYLAAFRQARAQQGIANVQGFLDGDELQLAMASEAYDTNPEYREAVAEILAQTPDHVLNISATSKGDGLEVQVGQTYSSDKATVESMQENAYREYIMEEMGKLDLETAKGRYAYMQYLTDPKNAWLVDYQQSLVTTPSDRMHQSMLADQAAGKRDDITICESEPNDGSKPGEGGLR
jgi:hypothetical protein